jgi:hypothetical protein
LPSSRWKSRSSFTSGLLARSTEAQPLNAPSPTVPVTPLIITIGPLSRTSALAINGAGNRPGASSVISVGMFCRSSGGAGTVALMSNFSGRSLARALPVSLTLRSPPIVALALMPSTRFSTRSRKLNITMVPSLTVMRSMTGALPSAAAGATGLGDAIICPLRSRSSGTDSTGLVITSSVICGRPDHRLFNVMSAWMLPTVRRLLVSRSFGSCSVTSFKVTFSDGQMLILLEPAMVSR